ncbi:hypothetical protein HZA38_05845 [Candidatus Peregrinibacteria bacterium]|nr:hypothetical protein [Candidatus Peregrinibacteria bacterium]
MTIPPNITSIPQNQNRLDDSHVQENENSSNADQKFVSDKKQNAPTTLSPIQKENFLEKVNPQSALCDEKYLRALFIGNLPLDESRSQELDEIIKLYIQNPKFFQEINVFIETVWGKNNNQKVKQGTQRQLLYLSMQENVFEKYRQMKLKGRLSGTAFPEEVVQAISKASLPVDFEVLMQEDVKLRFAMPEAVKALVLPLGILDACGISSTFEQQKSIQENSYSRKKPSEIAHGSGYVFQVRTYSEIPKDEGVLITALEARNMEMASSQKQEQKEPVNAQGETEAQFKARTEAMKKQDEELQKAQEETARSTALNVKAKQSSPVKKGFKALGTAQKGGLVVGGALAAAAGSTFLPIFFG